jgi:hypothetical protein
MRSWKVSLLACVFVSACGVDEMDSTSFGPTGSVAPRKTTTADAGTQPAHATTGTTTVPPRTPDGGTTTGGTTTGTSGGTTAGTTAGTTGTTAGTTTGTTGTTAGTTAGTTGTTTTDAFTGEGPFTTGSANDESSNHHGGSSNAGRDCMNCHGGGNAPAFTFAGTISPATAGAEVRVVGPTGTEVGRAYSDSSGNFWVLGGGSIPSGALTGVRNAGSTKTMTGPISAGGCNGCHGQNTARISL